jgi:CHAD domain-containing protein
VTAQASGTILRPLVGILPTPVDAQSARFLLQSGKSVDVTLERLFRRVHRAGFLVLPARSFGAGLEGLSTRIVPGAPDSTAPGVSRLVRRFELEHREYPKGAVFLEAAYLRYAGHAPMDAIELEFDLRQGPPLLLERVLAIVGQDATLIPSRLTDQERAEYAASGRISRSRSAPGSHLVLESRWQDLGLAHLKALAVQLQENEPRAWEALEAEGVHQMRVTTRRLREALRTFAPVLPTLEADALAKDLHWLFGLLGDVRDLDVQLAGLVRHSDEKRGATASVLDGYRSYLRARQRRAHRYLVEGLAKPRYSAIVRNLQALITAALVVESPVAAASIAEAGPVALAHQLERVRYKGDRAVRKYQPRRMHKLRIEAKRLRYFLEYVAPVGGPAIDAGIKALGELQDILGDHQDAWVARDDLKRYRTDARLTSRERKAVRKLVKREAERVNRARKRFYAEWRKFSRASADLVLC